MRGQAMIRPAVSSHHRACASLAISGRGRAYSAVRAGTDRTERSSSRCHRRAVVSRPRAGASHSQDVRIGKCVPGWGYTITLRRSGIEIAKPTATFIPGRADDVHVGGFVRKYQPITPKYNFQNGIVLPDVSRERMTVWYLPVADRCAVAGKRKGASE
jgi:hypothetical protein